MTPWNDIAVESADIALLREEVTSILHANQISTHSYARTRDNIALAYTFNGIPIGTRP